MPANGVKTVNGIRL